MRARARARAKVGGAHQSGEALRLPSLPTMYSACLGKFRVRVSVRVRVRVRVTVTVRG
jgi:hypothetical protein